MAYKRKTYDEYQLMGNWGYGWDYVLSENSFKGARQQLRCYIENDPSAEYKIVKKRIKRRNDDD